MAMSEALPQLRGFALRDSKRRRPMTATPDWKQWAPGGRRPQTREGYSSTSGSRGRPRWETGPFARVSGSRGLRGRAPQQFKSLVLQFETALAMAELEEQTEGGDEARVEGIPTEYKTELCFRFLDKMLGRFQGHRRLGAQLRDHLWYNVYCAEPGVFDEQRVGDEPVPYYELTCTLKRQCEALEAERARLKDELERSRALESHARSELSKADHLKLQFVELEHALRQKASICKRLQRANDRLISHNEDVEQQLVEASQAQMSDLQLRRTLRELDNTKRQATVMAAQCKESAEAVHDLRKQVDVLKAALLKGGTTPESLELMLSIAQTEND